MVLEDPQMYSAGVGDGVTCRPGFFHNARVDVDVTEAELVLDRLVDTGVVHTIDSHYFVNEQVPGLQTALWDMYQMRLRRESTQREEQLSAGGG